MPTNVVGLVLIESSRRATVDPDEVVRQRRARFLTENRASLLEDFAGMFGPATSPGFRDMALRRLAAIDPALTERVMEDMTRWDAGEAVDALRAVRVPALVIQSTRKDPGQTRAPLRTGEMSTWLRLVGETIPGDARVAWLPGLGHFPQVEARDAVNTQLVDFIERVNKVRVMPRRGP